MLLCQPTDFQKFRHSGILNLHTQKSCQCLLLLIIISGCTTLNDTQPSFPALDTVNHIAGEHRRKSVSGDIVPIAIMNFKYNKIKPDAIENGLLTIENGKLRSVVL